MKKCILEITDEVNCRLNDLDITTRRKLVDELSYFLPYARHTPAFKLGRWDGKIRYADIGGRTYINLLDRLLPIIERAGYEIDLVDNHISYSLIFNVLNKDIYLYIT